MDLPAASSVPSREVMLPPYPPTAGRVGTKSLDMCVCLASKDRGAQPKRLPDVKQGWGLEQNRTANSGPGSGPRVYLCVPYMPCKLASLRVNVDVDDWSCSVLSCPHSPAGPKSNG